jgi:hypothetical protein
LCAHEVLQLGELVDELGTELPNSDVEADVALSRCATSGPRSLTSIERRSLARPGYEYNVGLKPRHAATATRAYEHLAHRMAFAKALARALPWGQTVSMPRVRIPEIVGDLAIVVTRAGTPAVTNGRTGKNKVFIPCRDHEHAKDVVRKIREAKPGVEILL